MTFCNLFMERPSYCKCKQIQQHYKQKNVGSGFFANPVHVFLIFVRQSSQSMLADSSTVDSAQVDGYYDSLKLQKSQKVILLIDTLTSSGRCVISSV